MHLLHSQPQNPLSKHKAKGGNKKEIFFKLKISHSLSSLIYLSSSFFLSSPPVLWPHSNILSPLGTQLIDLIHSGTFPLFSFLPLHFFSLLISFFISCHLWHLILLAFPPCLKQNQYQTSAGKSTYGGTAGEGPAGSHLTGHMLLAHSLSRMGGGAK